MNLFVNYYEDKDEYRNKEIQQSLLNNLNCSSIDKIYAISGTQVFDKDNKIFHISQAARPTFRDFFNIINRFTQPNDINIIANSDIYFQDVDYNHFKDLGHNDCYALSRWDVQPDGSAIHYSNPSSQDTWIFRGAIKMVEGCNFFYGHSRL